MRDKRHAAHWLAIVLALALFAPGAINPVHAQADLRATVVPHRLNVRQQPDRSAAVVGQLVGGTQVRVTGREDNPHDSGLWVFVASADGALSGWTVADYLRLEPGAAWSVLPVVDQAGAGEAAPPAAPASAPITAAGIPAGVVPAIGPHVREIAAIGQSLGNSQTMVSKIGDSITANEDFLTPLGGARVEWGAYGALQPVYRAFLRSFARPSLAARAGWTSLDLLNPASTLAPGLCGSGETPLACEYRVARPAVALIMIGTNDIALGVDDGSYRRNLEAVVQISIDMGVIPVLSTIPDNLTNPVGSERVHAFNAIIRDVASSAGIPLWDYWLALQGLPNRGLAADNYHPSGGPAPGATVTFTPGGLQNGYTVRNLTALMVLDAVWRGAY